MSIYLLRRSALAPDMHSWRLALACSCDQRADGSSLCMRTYPVAWPLKRRRLKALGGHGETVNLVLMQGHGSRKYTRLVTTGARSALMYVVRAACNTFVLMSLF